MTCQNPLTEKTAESPAEKPGKNRAEIQAGGITLPDWSAALAAFAEKIMDFRGKDNWDLSILLCDNQHIRGLNREFRNIDEPTDILSFELGETLIEGEEERFLAGDLVISLEMVEENARYFKVPADEELRRLIIHGILHLEGQDHRSNGADEPMLVLQEEILTDEAISKCQILKSLP